MIPPLRSLLLPILCGLAIIRADGATLTVTTTADGGPGSLREAIVAANQTLEADVIVFELPGAQLIELSNALPALSGMISILNEKPGVSTVTIQRSTASGTPAFRIFEIGPSATVTMVGLTVTNGATTGPARGGGIFNGSAQLTLRRCTITGNSSENGGGGISSVGGYAVLDLVDCIISNNSTSPFSGGGIDAQSWGRTTLTNCTMVNNSAPNGGGIRNAGGSLQNGQYPPGNGELRIKNCTFSGNSARDSGGAIYDQIRNPDLVSILNSTITGNFAGFKGGGISAFNGETGAYLRLGNSIIAGNSCTNANGDDYGHDLAPGLYVTDGHNIVGREPRNITGSGTTTGLVNGVKGDQVGTTKNPIDPKLGPLQMNGGSTPTHALLIGSSAINNGDSGLAPVRDQRAYARPDSADIGAFEYGGTYPLPLLNISTRGQVQPGNNVLIAGFIITGAESKRIIARACGPSIGVSNQLANPRLDLWNSAGQVIASNDDWQQAPNRQEIINSSLAPTNDAEAAILTILAPGAYTAVVNGVNDTMGIGLVEVYDLGADAEASLANISTRGFVGSGDDVMIGGFIVSGTRTEKIIIRGLGPSLPFAANLPDPTLELHDQNGTLLRANDNWRTEQQAEVEATGIPPTDDRESAIVSFLSPANYTAILRGTNGSVGVGLVEIYALD